MYSPLKIAGRFIRHWIGASNGKGHGIHSPFVFEFVSKVLNDKTDYPAYVAIEKLRKHLLADNTPVPVEDYGAGSVYNGNGTSRSVRSIASGASKDPKTAQLLFRIAQQYAPHYVLELGTSLGISTAYLASGQKTATVVTGEGNQVLASLAKQNFRKLGLENITMVNGNFDNTLPEMIASVPHLDLAFIDGNHREQPTISYFHQLLKKTSASSILIFDDIHWSDGMESAWKKIKGHPSVMMTIDVFTFGIVVFRPDFKVKQHFRIRF